MPEPAPPDYGCITYRALQLDEAHLLGTIDRSERSEAVYRIRNRMLVLEERRQEVHAWDTAELAAFVTRLKAAIASRGRALGAWDEPRLVGLGSLDAAGVGGDSSVMKLDLLYVSAGYRGRGIGRTLTQMLASHARARGATALYISATPTRATVDAYRHMGAVPLQSPDPEMLASEPDDIHLTLKLT